MLRVHVERWPIAEPFTIARGSKTEAAVVVVTLDDGTTLGRGEAVPYARYGESVHDVVEAVRALSPRIEPVLNADPTLSAAWAEVATLAPGAARNVLDLALWDLRAKRSGRSVAALNGRPEPRPVETAFTLPIRDPDTTRHLAAQESARPLLKVKVGSAGDLERIRAAREGAPHSRLIVDANEGWDLATLAALVPTLSDLRVELIEQPLPAGDDAVLASFDSPVPLCADESFHGSPAALDRLAGRYDAVNVKLDKQGGLTAALEAVRRARELDLSVMVGCMVATSLAIAPAVLLAQDADWADLDGPLLLTSDREAGLRFEGSFVHPPTAALWG